MEYVIIGLILLGLAMLVSRMLGDVDEANIDTSGIKRRVNPISKKESRFYFTEEE